MSLSNDAINTIKNEVRKAGDHLMRNMEDIHELPALNPYSFIWDMITYEMGKSYKECSDDDLEEILQVIEKYKHNPL